MSDITRLSNLLSGMQRGIDLSSNAIVVDSVKVGGASGTSMTKTILDNLVSIQSGSSNTFYYYKSDFTVTSVASKPVLLNDSGKLDSGLINVGAISHSALADLNTTNYTHLSSANASGLTGSGDTSLHYHTADRSRANHSGTQAASTISDFASAVESEVAALLDDSTTTTIDHGTAGSIKVNVTQSAIDHANIANRGTNTHTQIDTHLADTSIHKTASDIQGIAGGMVDDTDSIDFTYTAGTQKISAVIKASGVTNTMLAGSIDDGKLSNSYLYASGTRALTGVLAYNSAKTFSSDLDLVSKGYVDSVAQGLDVHAAVHVMSSANLAVVASGSQVGKTLSFDTNVAPQSIDGHLLVVGDRVLVNGQTNKVNNGIYTVTQQGDSDTLPCILTRATDFDGSPAAEVATGDFVFVQYGTSHASSGWVLKAITGGISPVVDTNDLDFMQFSAAGSYTADGQGIELSSGQFALELDGGTLSKSASGLKVASAGITATQINSSALGNGLTGGSGTSISVNHDSNGFTFSGTQLSLQLDGTTLGKSGSGLKVATSGITANEIAANAVGAAKIRLANNTSLRARNAADDDDVNILKVNASNAIEFASMPITPSTAPSANYEVANKKYVDDQVSGKSDASQISFTPGTLSDWSGAADPGMTDDGLDQLASRVKSLETSTASIGTLDDTYVAGESLAAGGVALRFMKAGDVGYTAGRVIKADKDATTIDNFYCIGIALAADQSAGDNIKVVKVGKITVTGHSLTVGQPFYLSAAGGLTSTPPTTAGHAVVKLGLVKDANTLEVQIQAMYVC